MSKINFGNIYKQLVVFVTMDCNLHCEYCFEKGRHRREYMRQSVIEDIKQQIQKDRSMLCDGIEFMGGEPMMAQDTIIDFIKTFKDSLSYVIMTNGTIPFDHFIEETRAYAGNILFNVSYDFSSNEMRHNELTKEKLQGLINKLNRYGYTFSFASVYTPQFAKHVTQNILALHHNFAGAQLSICRLEQMGQFTDEYVKPMITNLPKLVLTDLYGIYRYGVMARPPENIHLPPGKEGLYRRSYLCDVANANMTVVGVDGRLYACQVQAAAGINPYADTIKGWRMKPQFYDRLEYNKGYTDCLTRHDTNQHWEKAVEENRQLWQTVHDKLQRLKEAQDAY